VNPAILILRPEPGASRTGERARALGLEAVRAPLFEVRPLAWQAPPPEGYDGVLLTSAHAAREAGPALSAFAGLPCYAAGEATAEAARAAGFMRIEAGDSDGAATLALAAMRGARRLFHPSGRDHIPLAPAGIEIDRRIVYAAEAAERLPGNAVKALALRPLVLIHSPRAASVFGKLVGRRETVSIAAISAAAAEAAGEGWALKAVAAAPRDEALLELAVKLCQTARW
jgi:uroporphyrinogen-III synthase